MSNESLKRKRQYESLNNRIYTSISKIVQNSYYYIFNQKEILRKEREIIREQIVRNNLNYVVDNKSIIRFNDEVWDLVLRIY